MEKACIKRPKGGPSIVPKSQGALSAFGQASHAMADFYAHSNWVELNLALGDTEKAWAPCFGPEWPPAGFPGSRKAAYDNIIYRERVPAPTGRRVPTAADGFNHCTKRSIKTARIKATAPS